MFDIAVHLLAHAVPLVGDGIRSFRSWRARRRLGVGLAEYQPGTGPIPPLPPGWERWRGARPEPRGAPSNTILNVRGLDKMSPAFRAGLLDLCDEFGIPVDSMAIIIANESMGFNPSALNPLPAAGLIQLTVGANLPGFVTKDAIRAVVKMSAEEQLVKVIRPYYARIKSARGADPGLMYMLNFLPADAGKTETFRLGDLESSDVWRRKVYEVNSGFAPYLEPAQYDDKGKRKRRPYFTIADVYAVSAQIAGAAKGRRITVDGRIREPSAPTSMPTTSASSKANSAKPGALSSAPVKATTKTETANGGPKLARTSADPLGGITAMPKSVYDLGESSGGILLSLVARGRHLPPEWARVQVGDLEIEVMTDALRAPLRVRHANGVEKEHAALRLPVSYRDQIEVARLLGCVSMTKEWWDAVWSAAPIKLAPAPLPAGPKMGSIEWTVRYSDSVDEHARPGVLIRDPGKGWILHPRLSERREGPAINYGWIVTKTGKPIQSAGGRHDDAHHDYSQTCSALVRRIGRLKGREVDLLDYLEATRPDIGRRFLDVYR